MTVEAIHGGMNPNFLRSVSRGLLQALSKGITLSGEENIPCKGPAIVITNHMGTLEALPPYVYLAETPILFTKKENLKILLLGNFLRSLGSIPVSRGDVDRSALREATEVLVNKKGIIFTCPEGTRGRDKDGDRTVLKKAKPGVIYIAQKAANELKEPITISPWAIRGTEYVLPTVDEPGPISQRFMIQRNHIFITIGTPYLIYPSDKRLIEEEMQNQIDSLMLQIRDLLPAKYHGYYAQ
jgi:1-acyl-sn-glycerol-3-phosphate acyltransferase